VESLQQAFASEGPVFLDIPTAPDPGELPPVISRLRAAEHLKKQARFRGFRTFRS